VAVIPRVDRSALAAHVAAETPCVIAGGAADWPATRRWSVPYLTERVGAVRVRYKCSSSHAHPDFRAATLREWFATGESTLGELLGFVTSDPARATRLFTGDEQWLVRRRDGVTTVHEPLRPLLDDAPVPDLVPAERLYTVWAWFSGAGVRTWLHYDNNGCHNLNAQLTGAKDCTLFPPSELAKLRLYPAGGPNPAVNCSAIDLEHETPDAASLTARLEAGDLLFIPAWWLHAFVHLGELNCNVNYWWKPEVATTNPVAEREATLANKR
jgi:hypothetical protein